MLLMPPRPPPKNPPLGRRLAQAVNAFANFEFPPPNPPLGPVPPRRKGEAPPPPPGWKPPPPPPGRNPRPLVNETPCAFRHAAKALAEPFADEEPVAPVLAVEFDAVDFGALVPPQAATPSATTAMIRSATAARSLGGLQSRRAACLVGFTGPQFRWQNQAGHK